MQTKAVERKWTVRDMPSQEGSSQWLLAQHRASASIQLGNLPGREPR